MRLRRAMVVNLGYGRRPTMRAGAQWYRIENAKTPTPSLYLYDEIGFWGVTAADLVAELNALDARTIDVHVNSPGGEVFDGIAIYNALLTHKATINVFIDGLAASAASFIAQAGDSITMARNAQMMIHDAQGLCIGDPADMLDMHNLLEKCSDNIADIYAQRAGSTIASWRSKMRDETWYSATEAVSAGLADTVAERDAEPSNKWDLSIYAYAGREAAPAPVIEALADRRRQRAENVIRQPIDLDTLQGSAAEPEPAPVVEPEPSGTLPADPIDYAAFGVGLSAMFHDGVRQAIGAIDPLPPADLNIALRDVFFDVPEPAPVVPEQPAPAPAPTLGVLDWRQLMREVTGP